VTVPDGPVWHGPEVDHPHNRRCGTLRTCAPWQAVAVPDDSKIATHAEPTNRERSNYVVRLALAMDGMPGRYEQMWTRTADGVSHELCCIPFFTYGLSLGDVITVTSDDGPYEILSKSGHRTIRFAFNGQLSAHQHQNEVHAQLLAIGVAAELRGAHGSYGAIDLIEDDQAAAVIALLNPFSDSEELMWEWADPA
jgi:hypothetical protein